MLRNSFVLAMGTLVLFAVAGCDSGKKKGASGGGSPKGGTYAASPAAPKSKRVIFTTDNNPTKAAQRGEPSLDDHFRPAAWILMDGREGRYVDVDGSPQLQWMIDSTVKPTPTFRVEVFEPLLGNPTEFSLVVQSRDVTDGVRLSYAIKAKDGTFEFGRDYPLNKPGPNFEVRNLNSGDVIQEIAPFPPGQYIIAGAIKNTKSGAGTAAVTAFSVGE